jgi:hypothetical protein
VAEHCQRIDIRRWHREGQLRRRYDFVWQWTSDGEVAGSISVMVSDDSIRLSYTVGDGYGGRRDASQTIITSSTPCHYGGSRPWFTCPVCRNRAGVLFLRGGRFACRKCQRVSYRSQSGSVTDRIAARFHKLDALVMGGKPKWQRQATRDRLVKRYLAVSERFDAMLAHHLAALGVDLGELT